MFGYKGCGFNYDLFKCVYIIQIVVVGCEWQERNRFVCFGECGLYVCVMFEVNVLIVGGVYQQNGCLNMVC